MTPNLGPRNPQISSETERSIIGALHKFAENSASHKMFETGRALGVLLPNIFKKREKKGEHDLLKVIRTFWLRRTWSPQPLSAQFCSVCIAWGGQTTFMVSGKAFWPLLDQREAICKAGRLYPAFLGEDRTVTLVTGPWALPQHPYLLSSPQSILSNLSIITPELENEVKRREGHHDCSPYLFSCT